MTDLKNTYEVLKQERWVTKKYRNFFGRIIFSKWSLLILPFLFALPFLLFFLIKFYFLHKKILKIEEESPYVKKRKRIKKRISISNDIK